MAEAALGFSVHTGWAAAVAIAGPPSAPRVLDRTRIALTGSTEQDLRFAYHVAAKLDAGAAERWIATARARAEELARDALATLVSRLTAQGDRPVAAALLVKGGRALPGLPEILRSHTLIHSAEGELFRQVLREASTASGLRLEAVDRKDLPGRAAEAMGVRRDALQRRLAALGKALGPPWAQDQKDAVLAAVVALASHT